mmetsp:Transcript_5612/g.11645  ORF Transcript_5612/g.11645 Transcript_5612/m.11645 type:complete len:355 (-) Transcript_5612:258-1322(-)
MPLSSHASKPQCRRSNPATDTVPRRSKERSQLAAPQPHLRRPARWHATTKGGLPRRSQRRRHSIAPPNAPQTEQIWHNSARDCMEEPRAVFHFLLPSSATRPGSWDYHSVDEETVDSPDCFGVCRRRAAERLQQAPILTPQHRWKTGPQHDSRSVGPLPVPGASCGYLIRRSVRGFCPPPSVQQSGPAHWPTYHWSATCHPPSLRHHTLPHPAVGTETQHTRHREKNRRPGTSAPAPPLAPAARIACKTCPTPQPGPFPPASPCRRPGSAPSVNAGSKASDSHGKSPPGLRRTAVAHSSGRKRPHKQGTTTAACWPACGRKSCRTGTCGSHAGSGRLPPRWRSVPHSSHPARDG